jgi:hypothetical protein
MVRRPVEIRAARRVLRSGRLLCVYLAALLAGCASDDSTRAPVETPASAADARALIAAYLPPKIAERSAWISDIYSAFESLAIPITPDTVCSVIALTEQESSFRADPPVPGLAAIAWKEIDRQAEHIGVPALVVRGALMLNSPTGKSYSDRLDHVRTERELSEIFEDFIDMAPLGKTFFSDRNPVRTGGPMQVSVSFAEAHARTRPYPYGVKDAIRHEVFTRRGGMYFGIAHLLDYPASYDNSLYRFADYNAGRYASRNAAFQSAVARASGVALALDGDLLRYDRGRTVDEPGSTEYALRTLAGRLKMTTSEIRRDLERSRSFDFESTRLYTRLYALAEKATGTRLPRVVLPRLVLQSPKITRKLTTAWFANRVDERYRACLARDTRAAL